MQFLLEPARQLRLDGRAEPLAEPVFAVPATSVLPSSTPELFDERQGSFRWKERRKLLKGLNAELPKLAHRPSSQARAGKIIQTLTYCGLNAFDSVELRRVTGTTGVSHHVAGTMHCGRPLCPGCAPFTAKRRVEALQATAPLVAALFPGSRAVHCVLTVRHRLGVRFDALRSCFSHAWRGLTQTRAWRRGVAGFVRVTETKWSESSGHHLHIHAILQVKPGADVDELREVIRESWARLVSEPCKVEHIDRETGEVTTRIIPGRSCDFEAQETSAAAEGRRGWWSEVTGDPGDTFEYLVGKVLREEVTAAGAKTGSRPWDMPARPFLEVWHASKGMRWFSTGGCWKLKPELEDEERADELRDTTGEVIGVCSRADWQLSPLDERIKISAIIGSASADVVLVAWLRFVERASLDAADERHRVHEHHFVASALDPPPLEDLSDDQGVLR